MSKLKCLDCGQVFNDKFESCPNCGCPASSCEVYIEEEQTENVNNQNNQNTLNKQAESISDTKEDNHRQLNPRNPRSPKPDNSVDLPLDPATQKYYNGLFQPWYVNCDNPDDQHRYDTINEIILLINLCFRILLWWGLILLGVYLLWLLPMYITAEVNDISFSVFILIFSIPFAIYLVLKGFGWAFKKYFPMIHKLFIRLNQRYWLHMEYAKDTNKLDDL